MSQSTTGLPENVANFVAYLLGWITGLVMLLVEKDDATVRYHAAQSVTVFGSLTILNILLPFLPALGPMIMGILAPVTLVLWVVLLVMSLLGNAPRLAVISNFADQLLQRFDDSQKRLDRD